MGLLSVHDCGDSILIADEEKAIGRLPKKNLHPIGLDAFLKTNYNLQGSVNYQSWLSGVLAGAVLILGPPALPSEDQTEAATDREHLADEIDPTLRAYSAAGQEPPKPFVISTKNLPEDPGGILAISPENMRSISEAAAESAAADFPLGLAVEPAAKAAETAPASAGAPEPTAATVESPQAGPEPAAAPEASGSGSP